MEMRCLPIGGLLDIMNANILAAHCAHTRTVAHTSSSRLYAACI